MAAIKLDRLEEYISDVIPREENKYEKELWECKIEIDDYITNVA